MNDMASYLGILHRRSDVFHMCIQRKGIPTFRVVFWSVIVVIPPKPPCAGFAWSRESALALGAWPRLPLSVNPTRKRSHIGELVCLQLPSCSSTPDVSSCSFLVRSASWSLRNTFLSFQQLRHRSVDYLMSGKSVLNVGVIVPEFQAYGSNFCVTM
jgi:hypothetical protein